MCGSAMPCVNSAATRPDEPPARISSSVTDDRVEQVAAAAADLLGEADAEQAELGRGAVQRARHLAGPLPVGQVRHDLPVTKSRTSSRSCRRSGVSTATVMAGPPASRRPGAQQLAERLGLRVEPGRRGHPLRRAGRGCTKLTARRFGSSYRSTVEAGGLRQQLAQPLDGQPAAQPPVAGVGARPDAEVGVAALVAGPGADDLPERRPPGRAGDPGPVPAVRPVSGAAASAKIGGRSAGGDRHALAVGQHRRVRHRVLRRRCRR